MRIAIFSTKGYDLRSLELVNEDFGHELAFFETRLTVDTVALARGFAGVCIFVNDDVDAAAISKLAALASLTVAIPFRGLPRRRPVW